MSARFISITRGLVAVAVLVALTACATSGGGRKLSGNYAALYKQAESDVAAGRVDAALTGFGDAAKADPSRKEPWVRTAQLQFDKGNYANAILAAEEVVARDPDDLVADSVLALGGFRIANQSLQRLRGNGALSSESARTEAELLVKTMRETMGEDVMAAGMGTAAKPGDGPRRGRAPARRPTKTPSTSATADSKPASQTQEVPTSSDPFQNIGGN